MQKHTLPAVLALTVAAVLIGAIDHESDGPGEVTWPYQAPREELRMASGPEARTALRTAPAMVRVNLPDLRGQSPAGGISPSFRPGELLVVQAPSGFPATARAGGFMVVETVALPTLELTLHRVRLPAGISVQSGVLRLRQRFPGAVIDANHYFSKASDFAKGGDSGPRTNPPRSLIGWDHVPDDCGQGIRLGMIDAGIDADHPALRGADLDYRSFIGPGRQGDGGEHGTAVAALIVGQPDVGHGWEGLLPGAHLAAASIFEINPAGKSVATARALLEAVDWLIEKRVSVVNFSVAGPHNRVVRLAVERAVRRRSILVAAAGNWGSSTRRAYPAAYQEVIGVTALGADGRVYDRANRGPYIDFAAPGVGLWTAVPGGGQFQSGTSFASPYVAVMASLVLAQGAQPQVDGVRASLRENAIDLGDPGRDDVFGWGMARIKPDCGGSPETERSLGL